MKTKWINKWGQLTAKNDNWRKTSSAFSTIRELSQKNSRKSSNSCFGIKYTGELSLSSTEL